MPRRDGQKPNAAAQERREQAWELYKAGQTNYAAIGRALGVSGVTARAYIRQTIARSAVKLDLGVQQFRAVEVERLDAMLARVWPKVVRGELPAIDRALAIAKHRATLLGLDMPLKLARTDKTGEEDVASLSDEEVVRRVTALLEPDTRPARPDARGAAPATPEDERGDDHQR